MKFDWLSCRHLSETKIVVGPEYTYMTEVGDRISQRLAEGWDLVNIVPVHRKRWYGEEEVLFSVFRTESIGFEQLNRDELLQREIDWHKMSQPK